MGHKIKYINLAAQHNSIKKEIKRKLIVSLKNQHSY